MLKSVISLIKRGQTCLITNRHIPKDILYKDTIKSNRRNFFINFLLFYYCTKIIYSDYSTADVTGCKRNENS